MTNTRVRDLTKAEELALHLHHRTATDAHFAALVQPDDKLWSLLADALAETIGGTAQSHAADLAAVVQPLLATAGLPLAWPDRLTPALRDVLGMMCFELGPIAHAYQAAGEFVDGGGQPLKKRAEDEQAFMLFKFVGYALAHGEDWRSIAGADEIDRIVAAARAAKPDQAGGL